MSEFKNKCVILSYGFDSAVVLRAYSFYGLGTGDVAVLVVPQNLDRRSEAAIKEAEAFFSSLRTRGIDIKLHTISVDADQIEEIILKLARYIVANDFEYYIEASGGVRSICIGLFLGAIFLNTRINEFNVINESTGKVFKVPIPNLNIALSDIKKDILKAIKERGELLPKAIAELLNKDISTINRHLGELERKGLVQKNRTYRGTYKLTILGKMLMTK